MKMELIKVKEYLLKQYMIKRNFKIIKIGNIITR